MNQKHKEIVNELVDAANHLSVARDRLKEGGHRRIAGRVEELSEYLALVVNMVLRIREQSQ